MNKLVLNNNDVIQIEDYSSLSDLVTSVNAYSDIENIYDKLTDDNLSYIRFTTDDDVEYGVYHNMTLNNKEVKVSDCGSHLQVSFMIREKTPEEMVSAYSRLAISYLNDEQALTVFPLYPNWEDDPIGYHYDINNPDDRRRRYGAKLWNLNKSYDKQADWFPGNDPTLWTEIVIDHAGTKEDPIPVPISVTTSGFEYEYGKYYKENDAVYFCKREGEENGNKITLYYMPSSLIGHYFEKA